MTSFIKEFESLFLNIDFDKLLFVVNNPLVNSNPHYLLYKNRYLNCTQENYDNLLEFNEKYTSILNNEFVTETGKVKYYVTNDNELDSIRQKMGSIIINQRQLYNNFMNHIDFLNNCNNNVKQNLLNNKQNTNQKRNGDNINFSAKKLLSRLKIN